MVAPRRVLRPLDRGRAVAHKGDEQSKGRFVGSSIRDLRRARDVTLTRLSELTGLSVGFLSQVERGISSPSVKALHDISRALGVTISWFFLTHEEVKPQERDYIVRANRRRHLSFESGIVDELLSPNLSGQLELLYSRFPPGAESGDQPYTHKGEEAGVIVQGSLELWIGGEVFILDEGDSFAFPSTEPHRYRNVSSDETVVIWAITPPTY
jgi:transcriptional regulator with XRE-family HTH domain